MEAHEGVRAAVARRHRRALDTERLLAEPDRAEIGELRAREREREQAAAATFVFPAPVGAHSSRFSLLLRLASAIRIYARCRLVMPLKASRVHAGRSAMGTGFSFGSGGARAAGTCTSS